MIRTATSTEHFITGINPEAISLGVDRYDRPLCPGLQPGPPSQTPGGLGQRYWSVSAVTLPPKLELRRSGSSGPSSLMLYRVHSWIVYKCLYFHLNLMAMNTEKICILCNVFVFLMCWVIIRYASWQVYGILGLVSASQTQISLCHNLLLGCQIILRFCTEHDNFEIWYICSSY